MILHLYAFILTLGINAVLLTELHHFISSDGHFKIATHAEEYHSMPFYKFKPILETIISSESPIAKNILDEYFYVKTYDGDYYGQLKQYENQRVPHGYGILAYPHSTNTDKMHIKVKGMMKSELKESSLRIILDGYCTTYYKNGMTEYEGNLKHNLYDGKGYLFYPDGRVKAHGHFRMGLLDGLGIHFGLDYIYRGPFLMGQPHGIGLLRDGKGNPLYYGPFEWGMRNGIGILYTEEGEVQGSFKDNVYIGPVSTSDLDE